MYRPSSALAQRKLLQFSFAEGPQEILTVLIFS